jgi:coproporphyrinogen III oxidase
MANQMDDLTHIRMGERHQFWRLGGFCLTEFYGINRTGLAFIAQCKSFINHKYNQRNIKLNLNCVNYFFPSFICEKMM